jgi:hypothetical protein
MNSLLPTARGNRELLEANRRFYVIQDALVPIDSSVFDLVLARTADQSK